ncbi:chemotaxis protein [Rhizobium sp. SL42]|nr:chemotaxis protein [Rhizobium sp. SL42]
MKHNFKLTTVGPDLRTDLVSKLNLAHSAIERSFLDAGAVLVSVMEILNGLVDILDRLTNTLDGETTASTVKGLRSTVSDLALLPKIAEARHTKFVEISDICYSSSLHLDDMRETIRYLRTFAITVKITGAGLAEFAEFADEIRDRVQFGAEEVDKFVAQLGVMRAQLQTARDFAEGIRSDFDATVPRIVSNLDQSSSRIAQQYAQMSAVASDVKQVTGRVQGKIASVLSGLQIGDITRQRIEHVQSTFEMLDAFLASPEGGALSAREIDDLNTVILHLCHAQLDETLVDFRRQCRGISSNIASFSADASQILVLRDKVTSEGGGEEHNALKSMEADLRIGCELAERVRDRSGESDSVVGSVTATAQHLLKGIEVIRSIKTDIHYMALNSNLRCSRLGDAGRSVNVVSGELRLFAGKLETPADAIVADLHAVEAATQFLSGEATADIGNLGEPLRHALAAVQTVGAEMEKGLQEFAIEGQAVFARISAAATKLDFESELGGVLDQCLGLAAHMAADTLPDTYDLASRIEPLSSGIFRIYTMAQERDIHLRYLNVNSAGSAAPAETAKAEIMDDDDLFADALF